MFSKDGVSTDTTATKPVQQATAIPVTNVEYLAEHRAKLTQVVSAQSRQNTEDAIASVACADTPASILVLADRFPYSASIEVNDVHWVRAQFSTRTRDQLIATVKKILWQEFGRNRVKRDAFHFAVQHGNIDKLVKKLVQVQFYTNQILLPEYNLMGERNELNGVSITWGVGPDLSRAKEDRIRKRNQKYCRR